MLSDFDLAKQSGEPGGRPATIHQEGDGVRYVIAYNFCPSRLQARTLLRISDTTNRYPVMYRGLPY